MTDKTCAVIAAFAFAMTLACGAWSLAEPEHARCGVPLALAFLLIAMLASRCGAAIRAQSGRLAALEQGRGPGGSAAGAQNTTGFDSSGSPS